MRGATSSSGSRAATHLFGRKRPHGTEHLEHINTSKVADQRDLLGELR